LHRRAAALVDEEDAVTINVNLPANNWDPRPHQGPLWEYLQAGGKRAVAVWHRRAGKDEICLHHAATSAFKRVGNYWHCLPEYNQGRKAIWTAVNGHTGKRRIDEAFPHALRANTNDNEMFIRFKNGSTWQVIGSDRYNATVGAGVVGITYSEFALSNPSAWAYHRPMLEENDGWAAFISTPRGRNHLFAMLNHARTRGEWFSEVLTAANTGALSQEQLREVLAEYVSLYGADAGRAAYEQEYMCSFTAAILGAYYATEMSDVRNEGRILDIEPDLDRPIHRAWDIGVGDDTVIWFYQAVGAQLLILDVYSNAGVGVEHYRDKINEIHEQRGWLHGDDYVPHDAKIKEWGSGRTRVETMQSLGLKPILVPLAGLEDGINAVRRTLPLCVFHTRCEPGVSALEQYQREWDDDNKVFKKAPLHNWASHFADAFRYLAQGWKPAAKRVIKLPEQTGLILRPPAEPRRGIRI
jgi:phage terminase large subunit